MRLIGAIDRSDRTKRWSRQISKEPEAQAARLGLSLPEIRYALFGDLDPEDREWAEHLYYRNLYDNKPWIERVTTDRPARRTSRWSRDRLQRLFDSFAARLWPEQLTGWRVETRSFTDISRLACCDNSERRVYIDLDRLKSDRRVRGVLLHEMCHAAAPGGHGLLFFQQVERLLTLGIRAALTSRHILMIPDGDTLPRCATLRRRSECHLDVASLRK